MAKKYDHSSYPASQSCRVIDFEEAKVYPGFLPETWFLTVKGTKNCSNMKVDLIPLVYIKCPEYWGIEVIGCLPSGICLTALGHYDVTIPLAGITGSTGIEVIGANKKLQIEVSGGCKG